MQRLACRAQTPSPHRHATWNGHPARFPSRCLGHAVLALFFVAIAIPSWADEPELEINANRSQIYLGESVYVDVTVKNTDERVDPDLSSITNATVEKVAVQRMGGNSFQLIINNRVVRRTSSSSAIKHTYRITPHSTGRLAVGPVTIHTGKRKIAAKGPDVTVLAVAEQDIVTLAVEASRESVLIDEPIEILLRVRIRRLSGRYADARPYLPNDPPRLTAPYLGREPIDGLAGPDPGLDAICSAARVSRGAPGLSLNNIARSSDPFGIGFGSMFGERELDRFEFSPAVVTVDGKDYYEHTLRVTFVPKELGTYTFGPVIFKGNIAVEADDQGRARTESIYAVGPARDVRVVPPPEEGRPPSFIGALGTNMQITSTLDAQSCNVGDPLKLQVAVSGDIHITTLTPPALSEQESLTDLFKVYDDTLEVSRNGDITTMEWTIRPTQPGSHELPPVRLSYYDTSRRTYRSAASQPIPIKVRETEEIGMMDLVGPSTNALQSVAIRASQPAIPAPLFVDERALVSRPLVPLHVVVPLASAGPLFLLLTAVVRGAGRRRRSRTTARRRAGATARDLLRSARRAADPADARTQILEAIRTWVAARFDIPAAGLTPPDLAKLLREQPMATNAANRVHAIYARHFEEAFSRQAGETDIEADCRELEALFRSADRAGASRRGATLPLAIAVVMSVGVARAESDAGHRFLWRQANTIMATADDEAEYLRAADIYQRLVERGLRNGHLFYNLGTALLLAGRNDDARHVLQRAERYLGRDREVLNNMRVLAARAGSAGGATWYRFPLFWHYGLALPLRIAICAALFSVVCIGLAMRMSGLRTWRPTVITGAIALAFLGSSVLTSLHQESTDRATRPDIQLPATVSPAPESAP